MPTTDACGSETMTTLYARVARLDATCCPNGVADCPNGSPTACSVACGAALSPLMDECGRLLNVLFDAADGVEDGTADIFRSLMRKCNTLRPQDILAELQPLQAAGRCPDSWTEGIGATAVAAGACSDARPNCVSLTQLMSCAGDFCNTVGAACAMTGQCDKTCGFCGDGPAADGPPDPWAGGGRGLSTPPPPPAAEPDPGGGRGLSTPPPPPPPAAEPDPGGGRGLSTPPPPPPPAAEPDPGDWGIGAPPPPPSSGGHHRRQRRLQAAHACSPDVFSAAAAAVTDACCDDATGAGCTGVPTECDARCGIVFIDFYARCAELLRVYEPAQVRSFGHFFLTSLRLKLERILSFCLTFGPTWMVTSDV